MPGPPTYSAISSQGSWGCDQVSFRIHDYVDSHAERRPDAAAIRLRESVTRLQPVDLLGDRRYDLVVGTGVFYKHYAWQMMQAWVRRYAVGIIVTCHLDDSEILLTGFREVHTERFPYRRRTEVLRVFMV